MKILTSFIIALLPAVALGASLPADPDKVEYGQVRFQLVHQGEAAGEMFYAMEKQGSAIVFHDATTLLPHTRESATGVMDAATFAPRSMVVDGDFDRTVFDADLSFANGKATGVYRIKRPNETQKTDHQFEADMPDGAILRASIFGLVAGLPLEEGASFDFQWFNSLSRAVEDARIEVAGIETIETPAGRFECFVAHLKATPENIIYVTADGPRRVVRIDVVGQDMRFERLPAAPKE